MTRNARFFGSFFSFFRSLVAPFFCIWGFPGRKIPHCVAFECSSQAKTKQDPKLRFFSFPKNNSLPRACIHAIARSSLPKASRLCSEPLATYHIDYKANFWRLVNKWSGLFFPCKENSVSKHNPLRNHLYLESSSNTDLLRSDLQTNSSINSVTWSRCLCVCLCLSLSGCLYYHNLLRTVILKTWVKTDNLGKNWQSRNFAHFQT